MKNYDSLLVLIPARGGSKGLPRKNILHLNGKPLIIYTIEAARRMTADKNICVSSDDQEIIRVAEAVGLPVPFVRPTELATDTASTNDVILHALDFYKKQHVSPEVLLLLQPTSPFRTAQHIHEALALYSPEIDMVVSVKETKSNPYFKLFEENERGFLEKSKTGKYSRRQDCPKVWEFNGALYVINTDSLLKYRISEFKKVIKYVMDEISSIDIDDRMDLLFAEMILRENIYQ